jgi:ring-1,2-phenylacetyl-CoA epoxidase subunit PaaC
VKPTVEGLSRPAVDRLVSYLLELGDDCLVASERLAELVTYAPELEEDVALANIALDLLGHARVLLSQAGALEDAGRDEDRLAYWRNERSYRNCLLVELPNLDFAHTVLRQLLLSNYQLLLYSELAGSRDEALGGFATKAATEVAYHLDHARLWTLRLGDGTSESHTRAEAALAVLWPYHAELFEADPSLTELVDRGVAVDTTRLREPFIEQVRTLVERATLSLPETTFAPTGGRRGLHTEHLGHLLSEMQHLHRSYDGATW